MNTLGITVALVLSALVVPALGGCAATSAPDEARAPEPERVLNRAGAIASAREDASRNYGDAGGQAVAQYRGGYWVVELHAKNGSLFRYAISPRDGSVHERGMVQ